MIKKHKIALVQGRFTVIHPGHVRLFRHAKELAETLLVAVQSDALAGSSAMIQEEVRLEAVKSNIYVDEAFIYDTSVESLIEDIKPDILLKGGEFQNTTNPELEVLQRVGGSLVFHDGGNWHSSTNILLGRQQVTGNRYELPTGYLQRHGLNQSDLIAHIDRFSSLNVCVIGDLIIDEYVSCHAAGLSREEPTVVVYPYDYSRFVGGAGIVAGHSSGLGASASLISVVGNDDVAHFAEDEIRKHGTKPILIQDKNRPTTLKQRFRAQNKGLLKVSHLHSSSIPLNLQDQILDAFLNIADDCDLLVLSDFNYGCLPQKLVDLLIAEAKSRKIIVTADSQSSSQSGDVSRFKGVHLLTPTEHEARTALRASEASLVTVAQELQVTANVENIFLSLSEDGVLILTTGGRPEDWISDRLPAMNRAALDPAGAGDSMLIAGSLTKALGGSIWEAALIGSLAAAIQVSRVGNVPITASDLKKELIE